MNWLLLNFPIARKDNGFELKLPSLETNHYPPPDHEYVLNQLFRKKKTVQANPAGSTISGLNLFANTPS
jgi:hypothetical protein